MPVLPPSRPYKNEPLIRGDVADAGCTNRLPIFTLRAFLRLLRLLHSFHRKRRRHISRISSLSQPETRPLCSRMKRLQAAQTPHPARHRQDGRITSLRPFQNQSETPSPAITLTGLHCRYAGLTLHTLLPTYKSRQALQAHRASEDLQVQRSGRSKVSNLCCSQATARRPEGRHSP